ncbi:MAG: DUF2794 domain-containing protein [Hyphomicrobiaceae bacterium]|nr:DUF2794 domain-containing protein [Hyphomicrobiaceae bacterium]
MSESEPIIDLRPALAQRGRSKSTAPDRARDPLEIVVFDRRELSEIFRVYGRMVAAGAWRDYALDMGRERAVFSIFRRSSECPIYRIEKAPKLVRRQGAYSVVSSTGLILKRGSDLRRVLAVFDKSLTVVR